MQNAQIVPVKDEFPVLKIGAYTMLIVALVLFASGAVLALLVAATPSIDLEYTANGYVVNPGPPMLAQGIAIFVSCTLTAFLLAVISQWLMLQIRMERNVRYQNTLLEQLIFRRSQQ